MGHSEKIYRWTSLNLSLRYITRKWKHKNEDIEDMIEDIFRLSLLINLVNGVQVLATFHRYYGNLACEGLKEGEDENVFKGEF